MLTHACINVGPCCASVRRGFSQIRNWQTQATVWHTFLSTPEQAWHDSLVACQLEPFATTADDRPPPKERQPVTFRVLALAFILVSLLPSQLGWFSSLV